MPDDDATSQRAVATAFAALCDIAINYPLWIVGKRLSAGLGVPAMGDLYKGGGSLWCSTGPTIVLEDFVTEEGKRHGLHSGVSACLSGAIAGSLVTAQVENCITRSHAKGTTVMQATAGIYRNAGVAGLILPHGMLATAAREIPFAGSLFFLRGRARDFYVERWEGTKGGEYIAEALASVTAACVGAPLSHPFSVISAHQQANDVSLKQALSEVKPKHLMRGVLPRTVSICSTMLVVPLVVEHYQNPWSAPLQMTQAV